MSMHFTCQHCDNECELEFDRLDPNDSVVWCETCNNYASGSERAIDSYFEMLADDAMDMMKNDF